MQPYMTIKHPVGVFAVVLRLTVYVVLMQRFPHLWFARLISCSECLLLNAVCLALD